MRRRSNVGVSRRVQALARVLDQYEGRYRELRSAASFGEYVSASGREADEELLTEPVLASILEGVLGFGKGDYFPQLGRGGIKPDFTPTDPVTHPFVLDAKGSGESLSAHVGQIRRYVEQRQLRHGILFNLGQARVYPRGAASHDRALSFELLPLWRAARGEQLAVGPDFEAFEAFCEAFSLRRLSTADKIARIRSAESWAGRLADAEVDVEFLVDQLRRLAASLAQEAGTRVEELVRFLQTDPERERRLLDELRQLALDIEPGIDVSLLPGDAILELPREAADAEPWASHPEVLVRSPESRGLLYGAIDDDYTFLVVVRPPAEPPRPVLDRLERFRPLLATRAEIARNPRRRWWEAAWPRSAADMAAPKVIALYRTDRGRFALDEAGEWQPSNKSTIVVGRGADAPVAYLCGLLNSELLDLWYAVRGKTPWHVRRNYEPKRMNELPYRRPDGDPRAGEVAERVRARSPSACGRSPPTAGRSCRTGRPCETWCASSRIRGATGP